MDTKPLFKSNGIYFAFIYEGNVFSRDGAYLGWVEGKYVWDANGSFRGEITEGKYIRRNMLAIPGTSRPPKLAPPLPQLPNPVSNILPISLPLGSVDAF